MQWGAWDKVDPKVIDEEYRQSLLKGTGSSCRVSKCELLPELALVRGATLQELSLWRATDTALTNLEGFPNLKKLDIGEASYITDQGLLALARLTTLTELVLPSVETNQSLTPNAVAVLQAALPQCRITGGPLPLKRAWWKFW